MFKRKVEKAVADWPHTKLLEDKPGMHITGKYITPKLTDRIGGLSFVLAVLLFAGIIYLANQIDNETVFIIAIAIAVIIPFYFYFWAKRVFSANINIKIFPDKIEANHRQYARSEPIEFRVEQHQNAAKEVAHEQTTGQRTSSTFRQSIEVVMQYGEKRIVLAAMREKDLEMAKALVIRVQNICNQFDEAILRMAEGQGSTTESAAGDFGPEPDMR